MRQGVRPSFSSSLCELGGGFGDELGRGGGVVGLGEREGLRRRRSRRLRRWTASTWAVRPAAAARARRCLLRASLEGVTAAPMT